MINVNVTYRVKAAFAEQNRQNIDRFLKDFKALKNLNFSYKVFVENDGQTFTHISEYVDEETQQLILNVHSFVEFQKARDESGLLSEPKIQFLNLVGSK